MQPKGTAQLTYTVAPEEALADTATYTSSDEAVATVDADGNVTAVADGTATITLEVNGVTAECEVTVSTKATSTTNATSNSNGASSSDGSSSASADSSSFAYGSLATDGNWWYIDSSDSAFQAVVANINAMRAAGGLPTLSVSGSLCSIAQDRAWYQIENNTLSHSGAVTSEILAQGQPSASAVCTVWQNSPSHYAVIMNPAHTQMGVGCWFEYGGKCVWCVTFS